MNLFARFLAPRREGLVPGLPTILLASAVALFVLTGSTSARTWHVPAEVPTLSAAIDSATVGDVVELAPGTYLESNLVLESGLTIRAGIPASEVTIDAGDAGRIFSAGLRDSISLVGLTLTGGLADNGAAARFQSCRDVEIRDCTFVANRTTSGIGGALHVSGESSIVIEDCLFQDNDAPLDDGGAVWLSCPTAEITRCTFVGNHAVNGAGISCSGQDVSITDCVFAENSAFNGGGLDLRGDAIVVADCLFVGNTAARGGAAGCWYGATPRFVGCTMVENAASDQGGGLYCTGGAAATVERSLLAFNTGGGAVACANEGSASLTCSDVHGNGGGDWVGCLAGREGLDGNFSLDPLFCPSSGGATWELSAASPCLPAHSPCGQLVGAFGAGCGASGAPTPAVTSLPRLLGNHPNPFNPSTVIRFDLPQPTKVSLRVYDVAGRLVRKLHDDEPLPVGRHRAVWRGKDEAGRGVASGVYFCRFDAGEFTSTKRMMLVR